MTQSTVPCCGKLEELFCETTDEDILELIKILRSYVDLKCFNLKSVRKRISLTGACDVIVLPTFGMEPSTIGQSHPGGAKRAHLDESSVRCPIARAPI